MGQEISQQQKHLQHHHKCNIIKRQNPQPPNNNNNKNSKHYNYSKCNGKYTNNPKDFIYTSTSISTAASTDEETYQQRQKYNFPKQTYEKTKVIKKLGLPKVAGLSSTEAALTGKYKRSSIGCKISTDYEKISSNRGVYNIKDSQQIPKQQLQRKNSSSADSGIYYAPSTTSGASSTSCKCSSITKTSSTTTNLSSSAPSICSFNSTSGCCTGSSSGFGSTSGSGCASIVSKQSSNTFDKQKSYLGHHLYIKSYLDILEEDEKARKHFKAAPPGGIRNYKPKILSESSTLSKEVGTTTTTTSGVSNIKQREKVREDLWI